MSKKMPERFMETGDTHVSGMSFDASDVPDFALKDNTDGEIRVENDDGTKRKDIRCSPARQINNKK
jgi:hypothetical protein